MTAKILDGKAIGQAVRAEIADRVARRSADPGDRPGLAVVLVGNNPASELYVRNKQRATVEAGMASFERRLPTTATTQDVVAVVRQLNRDPRVHGILVQLPVPPGVDAKAVLSELDPAKDVDGLTTLNAGRLVVGEPGLRPCTPAGVMELLDRSGIAVAGRRAVVVGRSQLVGTPMALMLMARGATVSVVHSRSVRPDRLAREADIVVSAAGRAGLVTADWIRPGAVVVDVGINRLADGTVVGDVAFAAVREKAGYVSPVPGGVGPMTVAMLIHNTWQAYVWQTDPS